MRSMFAAALLLTTACETLDSADIRTSGVHALLEVEADGSGQSVVRATLRSGGDSSNTFLALSGGDRLVATADGREKEMVESRTPFDEVYYLAGFVQDRPGTEFRVAFERPSENGDDAPDSRVEMPLAFELVSPPGGRLFVPDDDSLRVEWDKRSSDPVRVRLEGDCIYAHETWIDDDRGGLTLPSDAIQTYGRDSCRVDVTVERIRTGDLDPHFGEGGRIEARQIRRTYVVVRP